MAGHGELGAPIGPDGTSYGGDLGLATVAVHRLGLAASFSAEIDPNTLAARTRLADGLWDLYLYFGVRAWGCGVASR